MQMPSSAKVRSFVCLLGGALIFNGLILDLCLKLNNRANLCLEFVDSVNKVVTPANAVVALAVRQFRAVVGVVFVASMVSMAAAGYTFAKCVWHGFAVNRTVLATIVFLPVVVLHVLFAGLVTPSTLGTLKETVYTEWSTEAGVHVPPGCDLDEYSRLASFVWIAFACALCSVIFSRSKC
jgi:hypothetical protein